VRAITIAIGIAFFALLVYGLIAQSPNTTIDDRLARGQPPPAPQFRLAVLQTGSLGPLAPTLAGTFAHRSLSLSDLRGTPLVLNFWASWCIPCQQEASTLERAWQTQARPRHVLFLGLDMQDFTTDADTFMRHYAIDYPNIRDPTNGIALRYGVTGVPETFFISAQGRVVGHIIGASSMPELTAGITAALAGSIAGARQGGAHKPLR